MRVFICWMQVFSSVGRSARQNGGHGTLEIGPRKQSCSGAELVATPLAS